MISLQIDKNETLVSIITPTYNSANLILETIRSVQIQTLTNWEMIIVDDHSQDTTCSMIKSITNTDSRIKLVSLNINGGPALARNIALKIARGRYIAFLDSDDLWLPAKLESQVSFMREKQIAFSYTDYRFISEAGNKYSKVIETPSSLNYAGLLKNTAICCCTVMIDKYKTGYFEMQNIGHEDFACWLSLLKKGFTAYRLENDLACRRIVKQSVSAKKAKAARWVWRIYRGNEGLGFFYSIWCFFQYAWNAYRKNNIQVL